MLRYLTCLDPWFSLIVPDFDAGYGD